jgi:hypothetical protein
MVTLVALAQKIVLLIGLVKPLLPMAAQAARAGPELAAIIATTELVASSAPTTDLGLSIRPAPHRLPATLLCRPRPGGIAGSLMRA